ncbi:hypothetical protein [Geobacter sp.]|uniref:hypothetical protein n=1 Tax=Geobacter sp. TaxID=46610 RepID=UPI001AC69DA6|nr:hypothetical protein [Geobacter sp.]CAG1014908.1 hypothetical protein ANAEL_05115 [Anaerolineales bacterium]
MNRLFVILVCTVLQACVVGPTNKIPTVQLKSHNLVATDSRVRVITDAETSIYSTHGLVDPKRIICTEPSPDVATTLAYSLGIAGNVKNYASVSLSSQQLEGLAQLGERTAAIQLLRDKMYQNCLAYANGAISGTTYSLIMGRLDDAIVTLSLGDSAAGAFGRKLVSIQGNFSDNIDATQKEQAEGTAKIEKKAEELATNNKQKEQKEKALRELKASQSTNGNEEELKKLESELATINANNVEILKQIQEATKERAGGAGNIIQSQAGNGVVGSPEASVLREMQGDFLLTDPARDLIFACIVELGLREETKKSKLENMTDYLDKLFAGALKQVEASLVRDNESDLVRDNESEFDVAFKRAGKVAANYAGAILRGQHTKLESFCSSELINLINTSTVNFHDYRKQRAQLNTSRLTAYYESEKAKAKVSSQELLNKSIKLCNEEFKDDQELKKACLNKIFLQ